MELVEIYFYNCLSVRLYLSRIVVPEVNEVNCLMESKATSCDPGTKI